MEVRFLTAGDRAVSVEFGKTICLETNAKVRMLDENLKEDPIEGMIETVPTYCALIIHYRPEVIRYGKLVKELEKRLGNMLVCVDKMYCFGFKREPFEIVVDDFFKIG